jgi:hypothetical protein
MAMIPSTKIYLPADLNTSANENQVVDCVHPHCPESRYGHGSTLVAADPSEVLSELDDLAPEEPHFGPVVDVKPPTHASADIAWLPSGVGSTVVFVPRSVAADDLDAEESTYVRGFLSCWQLADSNNT